MRHACSDDDCHGYRRRATGPVGEPEEHVVHPTISHLLIDSRRQELYRHNRVGRRTTERRHHPLVRRGERRN